MLQARLAQQGLITPQQHDELIKKHLESEKNLAKMHNNKREQQLSHLHDKLADRRRKRLSKLRDEQETELSEVSE